MYLEWMAHAELSNPLIQMRRLILLDLALLEQGGLPKSSLAYKSTRGMQGASNYLS